MTFFKRIVPWIILPFMCSLAQNEESSEGSFSVNLPSFRAGLSFGFNYDVLKPPTRVDFDYGYGYVGINVPVSRSLDPVAAFPQIDDIFADSSIFKKGDNFSPTVSAGQYANTSVRVEVPMLGGVGTFSNTENVSIHYSTILGNPDLLFDSTFSDISLLVRGTVNVPLELSLGWETASFGYVYKVNRDIIFALNLHRHLFTFDVAASIAVDLLGNYSISLGSSGDGADLGEINGVLDYNSAKTGGTARGVYEAEAWSPSFALKLWRFGWTSRFGVDKRAPGKLQATYSLPFLIDPESFELNPALSGGGTLDLDFANDLSVAKTDSLTWKTDQDLHWQLPHGHTMTMDIFRDKLYVSYTKLFGEIAMKLKGIEKITTNPETNDTTALEDELGFDVGITVDHILLLSGKFDALFFNVGIFSLDFRSEDNNDVVEKLLRENSQLSQLVYAGGAMVPVLNFGSTLGTRMQLALEFDILPLPAVKSGIVYNF